MSEGGPRRCTKPVTTVPYLYTRRLMQVRYLVRDLLNACVIAKRDGSAYLYSLPTVLDSWCKVVCACVCVCVCD